MHYRLELRPYYRQFHHPLITNHGSWQTRTGILLYLSDEKKSSFGEIAPLPWFGSESFEQAWEYCQQLPAVIEPDLIDRIPDHLPACQFGFESAITALNQPLPNAVPYTQADRSALLPTGMAALQAWPGLMAQGYRTLKWKIGVAPIQEEQQILQRLLQALPDSIHLRLDANGSLTLVEAEQWLAFCDTFRPTAIEFLEQPLPPPEFEAMLSLSHRYQTTLALDESVATLHQLQACYQRGWRGVFVVKPAIVGSPSRLRHFCQQHSLDLVFSSVFETVVGQQAGLRLARELACERAVGYGLDHWFVPDQFTVGPEGGVAEIMQRWSQL